jgi:dTDP-D-glucose 4,6-dehydratase
MKYQYVDYPIALEAKDGVNHGYGWENKRPYLDSYLNITTETDFINPTGYASEKIWKPFGFFQPVLLVGSQGTLEFIRSFGFKTFDGFIDESYDNQKILYPNTNSGYGSRTEGMVDETNDLTPISHYGVTKCEAEDYILQESNGIVFRLATVFGVSSRMRLDLLVNEFVYKLLTDKYITLFEHEFVRNFIHIQDVSSAFEFMIENYDKYQGQIFNVGLSDTNINKKQLVERIQRQIPNTSITYSDYFEDPDKRNYVVSNEKIEKTGWKPQYSLDDGITELIQAYKMIVPQESSRYRNAFPLSYGQSI